MNKSSFSVGGDQLLQRFCHINQWFACMPCLNYAFRWLLLPTCPYNPFWVKVLDSLFQTPHWSLRFLFHISILNIWCQDEKTQGKTRRTVISAAKWDAEMRLILQTKTHITLLQVFSWVALCTVIVKESRGCILLVVVQNSHCKRFGLKVKCRPTFVQGTITLTYYMVLHLIRQMSISWWGDWRRTLN